MLNSEKRLPRLAKYIKWPSMAQIEAYRLVHVFGLKQCEAAILMGVSPPDVSKLLKKLRKARPDIFPPLRFNAKSKPSTRIYLNKNGELVRYRSATEPDKYAKALLNIDRSDEIFEDAIPKVDRELPERVEKVVVSDFTRQGAWGQHRKENEIDLDTQYANRWKDNGEKINHLEKSFDAKNTGIEEKQAISDSEQHQGGEVPVIHREGNDVFLETTKSVSIADSKGEFKCRTTQLKK